MQHPYYRNRIYGSTEAQRLADIKAREQKKEKELMTNVVGTIAGLPFVIGGVALLFYIVKRGLVDNVLSPSGKKRK